MRELDLAVYLTGVGVGTLGGYSVGVGTGVRGGKQSGPQLSVGVGGGVVGVGGGVVGVGVSRGGSVGEGVRVGCTGVAEGESGRPQTIWNFTTMVLSSPWLVITTAFQRLNAIPSSASDRNAGTQTAQPKGSVVSSTATQ